MSFAQEVLRLTNEFRAKNGRKPLTLNRELNAAAQKHSKAMAEGDFFSHNSLNGDRPWDRAEDEGYTARSMGENIAAGQRTPAQVVQGWIDSPGHRRNMLNPSYTELGVGYFELDNDTGRVNYNRYWTQKFGSGDLTPNSPAPKVEQDEVDPSIFEPDPAPVSQPPKVQKPVNPPLTANFTGTSGRNSINGNSRNNRIFGLGGNDKIRGRQGDDYIKGGSGNDQIWGDSGDDMMRGGKGNDTLRGGPGSDGLIGGSGKDVLVGGGNYKNEIDRLAGGTGGDRFVLGDRNQAFYTAGGQNDYVIIRDFKKSQGDKIQLNDDHRYVLGSAPKGVDGKGLFIQENGGRELVAVIQGDSNISLNGGGFVYV
ncbi:MAG: CAP domain-containing protein [Cyanobacteria bacterium P01_H01_bin.21]